MSSRCRGAGSKGRSRASRRVVPLASRASIVFRARNKNDMGLHPNGSFRVHCPMQDLFGTDKFDILPHAVALLAAYLLAIPIGWNREKEERSAGLRTFPLVAVASCGFIQAAESMAGGSAEALARVNEGVIVGMGFIGGGAI